ncbi:hypothetical protein ACR3K2_05820 [Cryptosporidium serpentis]
MASSSPRNKITITPIRKSTCQVSPANTTIKKRRLTQNITLSNEELGEFRTKLCTDHIKSKCLDPDTCFYSHCSAWQRRNPYKYKYSSVKCPDIDFLRKGIKGRMSLACRCRKGRICPYAHTKEEELYHPDTYKTKICNSYPDCKRYYCPFSHGEDDIRNTINQDYDKNWGVTSEVETSDDLTDVKLPEDIFNVELTLNHINDDNSEKIEVLTVLIECQKFVLDGDYLNALLLTQKLTDTFKKINQSMSSPNNKSVLFYPYLHFSSNLYDFQDGNIDKLPNILDEILKPSQLSINMQETLEKLKLE